MPCNDRQLTEAQRAAAFDQQRTGVTRGIRPFTGEPTPENIADYLNREVFPVLKQTRDKVNETFLQVKDNAPSGNPLAYYFSTTTTNADPTAGRMRLDNATQDLATTIRVSESNAQLVNARPWLDVMAGSATVPLGVVTLTDAINPGRFVRFDLDTMTDQGAYWDLAVTVLESSHDNPFVDGGAVVLAFIPGVASDSAGGALVPVSSLADFPAGSFLANLFDATEPPQAWDIAEALGDGLTAVTDVSNANALPIETVTEYNDLQTTVSVNHDIDMPTAATRLPGDRIVIGLGLTVLSAGASGLNVPTGWARLEGDGTGVNTCSGDMIELIIAADSSNDPGDTLSFTTAVASAHVSHVWHLRGTHPTLAGAGRVQTSSVATTDVTVLFAPWGEANNFWGTYAAYNNGTFTISDFPDDFTTGQGQVQSTGISQGYGSQLLRDDRLDATSYTMTGAPRTVAFTFAIPPRETLQIQLSESSSIAAETLLGNLFDYAEEARAWSLTDLAGTGLTADSAVSNGPFPEIDDNNSLFFEFITAADPQLCPVPPISAGQGLLMAVSCDGTATVATPTERPWQLLGTGLGASHRFTLFWLAPADVTALVAAQDDRVTLDLSTSNKVIVLFVAVTDHHPTQLPTLSAFTLQNATPNTTIDVGTVTPIPGDSSVEANYTYAALYSFASTLSAGSLVTPTNYTDMLESGSDVNLTNGIAWCRRQVRGSSENVGSLTYDTASNDRAIGVNVAFIPASVARVDWDGLGTRVDGSLIGTRRFVNALDSTSILVSGTDDSANDEVELSWERAALTGAVVASQNSNATTFGGILDNGAAENNRTNLNFIAGTNTTATVTDDAGNDELEIRFNVDDFPLTGLADQADDTFLANISGVAAPPTAVALTTLAGAGLTGGADAILAVGAGTRITVNANDVQLATGAAETFLGNFTAGVATADYRAGSSVAGAGLTYTAGGTLAVGAGTGLTVNANDVQISTIAAESFFMNGTAGAAVPVAVAGSTVAGAGLTYSTGGILAVGSSTSITVNANDIQRPALTGAVTASANSNTTAYGAIAALGVVANGTNASAVPTTIQAGADDRVFRRVSSVLDWGVLTAGMFPANVIRDTMIRDCAARTVIGNPTDAAADPSDVDHVELQTILALPTSGATSMVLWEDEDFKAQESATGALGTNTIRLNNETVWGGTSNPGTGAIDQINNIVGHIGIMQITTGANSADETALHMMRDTSGPAADNSTFVMIDFQEVVVAHFWVRPSNNTNRVIRVGFGQSLFANSFGTDGVFFSFDSATTDWFTNTRSGSTTTSTDTNTPVGAGVFYKLTIYQNTSNQVLFFIDDVLVATHTTNVPTADLLPGVWITSSTAGAKGVDLDRVQIWVQGTAMTG